MKKENKKFEAVVGRFLTACREAKKLRKRDLEDLIIDIECGIEPPYSAEDALLNYVLLAARNYLRGNFDDVGQDTQRMCDLLDGADFRSEKELKRDKVSKKDRKRITAVNKEISNLVHKGAILGHAKTQEAKKKVEQRKPIRARDVPNSK